LSWVCLGGGVGLICLFTAVSVKIIFVGDALWCDEIYTLNLIPRSWGSILREAAADVHPPIYYFVLKIWAKLFGNSANALELFSLIPCVLTMLMGAVFLAREFSKRAAFFFLTAFNFSSCIIYNATEIRMYSLALFFVLLVVLASYYVVTKPQPPLLAWLSLFFGTIAAAYTHYYAGGFIAIYNVLLFFYILKNERQKLKRLLFVGICAVILYLPWFFYGLSRAFHAVSRHNFRQENLTLVETIESAWKIFVYFLSPTSFAPGLLDNSVPFGVSLLLIGIFLTTLVRFFFCNRLDSKKLFFFISLLLTPVILFLPLAICGMFGKNLVEQRYFFPYIGLFLIILAIQFQWAIPRKLFYAMVTLMFIVSVVVTIPHCISLEQGRSEDFEKTFSPFSGKCSPNDLVVWDYRANYGYCAGFMYREFIKPWNGIIVNLKRNASIVSEETQWQEIGAIIVLRNDSEIYSRFQKYHGNEKMQSVKIEKCAIPSMKPGTTIFRVYPAERIRKWLELELDASARRD
jgi:uncharacterized membrane protein